MCKMRLRGFTVLEMLVTVTITGILSAIAVPGFGDLVLNTRRTTLLNDLVATVQMARTTAALRGRTVVVCPSADGATCGTPAAWRQGWIAFVNLDEDSETRAPGEPLLRHYRTGRNQELHVSLAGRGDTLQLRPFGDRSSNGTLTVCDPRGAQAARAVVIGVMGRPYVSDKTAGGAPLKCEGA